MTARRWVSLTAGEPGGVSYRVLLKAVSDAGHRKMVAAFEQNADEAVFDIEPLAFTDEDFRIDPPRVEDSDFRENGND